MIGQDTPPPSPFGELSGDVLPPIAPGEILAEEFMAPLELSARGLAAELSVPPNRISEIIKARRAITADTAIRLERYFGVSAEFWLTLQMSYELRLARNQDAIPPIKGIGR
ncbi:MAG: HigA family addiction module antitoxin [Alphaproteobacteria bacterium]|nr:HigA family addiction module antitoxin [Alphaproteobacteria bacterium]